MSGAIPPLPQYAFMAWCLLERRDNFFTFMMYIYCNFILHTIARSPMRLELFLIPTPCPIVPAKSVGTHNFPVFKDPKYVYMRSNKTIFCK
jgi:hypothetical protein